MSDSTSSGPNPLCEVGRRHPRDKHRMRPVEGHEHTWTCTKHAIFATLLDKESADQLERGDAWDLPDGGDGLVLGLGDERQGGIIVYYRAK